jgi:hypothetical protein
VDKNFLYRRFFELVTTLPDDSRHSLGYNPNRGIQRRVRLLKLKPQPKWSISDYNFVDKVFLPNVEKNLYYYKKLATRQPDKADFYLQQLQKLGVSYGASTRRGFSGYFGRGPEDSGGTNQDSEDFGRFL